MIELDKLFRLPERLIRTRINLEVLVQILLTRYLKDFIRIQTLGRYNEIYSKFTGSPTWRTVCQQILGQYLGQYSFTPSSQIHFLVEKLNITPQSHVLDLASGLGGLSCYLARVSGCHVIGVDASQMGVKIGNREAASQGLAERVSFEVGLLPDLRYQDCCFDAVISVDSVYAVPDKSQLFHGCYRVLKPGGRVVITDIIIKGNILDEAGSDLHGSAEIPLFPCLKGARSLEEYLDIFQQAGLPHACIEDHTVAFKKIVYQMALAFGDWGNFLCRLSSELSLQAPGSQQKCANASSCRPAAVSMLPTLR